MKVSKKADYALRALFSLVEHYDEGPISIAELAKQNDVPKRFLEHIMLDLKSQGWVSSSPGKKGGYILAKSPSAIQMGRVVRYFDNLLSPIQCVSVNQYKRCSQEPTCRFRRVFLRIRNDTATLMDQANLASVFAGEPVRITEVFDENLIGGAGI
jgi:Rrf2 family protein